MKKEFRLFLTFILIAVLLGGCSTPGSNPDNYPYEPDTPAPATHDGIFASEHGTMLFTGDGESITIDFDSYLAELTSLPEGRHKGSYVFLSGNLPPHGSIPVRYDTAHEMEITVNGQSAVIDMGIAAEDGHSASVGVNVVTPERIPMLFRENDLFFQIDFQKSVSDETVKSSYTQISQEEAKEMMARDDGHIIVDVRRQDEYDAGHIPGAILIPNESIETERPAELPDLDQVILIYCRSGRRSKEAAQKLFDMGYTNIYEFGGINTWTGDIVTEEKVVSETPVTERKIWTATEQPVSVRYDRLWEYSDYAESSDPETITLIVDAVKTLETGEPTDMATEDFTDRLTFTFLDGSTLRLEFEDQNWVTEDNDRIHVEGLSRLRSILDDMMNDKWAAETQTVPTLVIEANDHYFHADLEDNSSASAFAEKLSNGELKLEMHDYGGFEKVGDIPWELPRNDETITTEPGDVILYQGNQITIYYDENTWDFTRLARIENAGREELLEAFGDGGVTVTFWIEWSE